MTSNTYLIQPPGHLSPLTALQVSQQASRILQSESTSTNPFPLSLFSTPESSETWMKFENLMLACLRAGDDKSAHLCLEKLTQRFGRGNDRVLGLRGLYHEATAENNDDLEKILEDYEGVLQNDPVNMPIAKRRIALLKSISRPTEAISALVELLDASPTDTEAWCELAELYQSQGLSGQAIFSLEEAVLITPNAWNLHARLGELNYVIAASTLASEGSGGQKYLVEAMQRFCRSIELCDDYLRAYYGLKLTTGRLLESMSSSSKGNSTVSVDGPLPARSTIEVLNKVATEKLSGVVKSGITGDETCQAQLIAVRELLDRDTTGKK